MQSIGFAGCMAERFGDNASGFGDSSCVCCHWSLSQKMTHHKYKRSIRLSLCVIQEVNIKQLQNAAVLVPANLLFTGGHLIYQTWWRLSPRRPRGATGPPVAAAEEAWARTWEVPRPTAMPTRRGWQPSRRPLTTSTMPPTEALTLPRSLLLCPAQPGGAGNMDQMFTASRTCSCRCSLLVMKRMEPKWLVIHLTSFCQSL